MLGKRLLPREYIDNILKYMGLDLAYYGKDGCSLLFHLGMEHIQ